MKKAPSIYIKADNARYSAARSTCGGHYIVRLASNMRLAVIFEGEGEYSCVKEYYHGYGNYWKRFPTATRCSRDKAVDKFLQVYNEG